MKKRNQSSSFRTLTSDYTRGGSITTRATTGDPVFTRQFHLAFGHDLERGANELGVSVKTIQRWLKNGCPNKTARLLLNVIYRGYLPEEGDWQYWKCSNEGLHSPDGKIYSPRELNKWNIEKTIYMHNKWFIQDLKTLGLYDDLKTQVRAMHEQPVSVISA